MSPGGWRGGLSGLPTSLAVLCAECMCSTLLLLHFTSQKWQLGFWAFCILLFIICPHLCICEVISPILPFVVQGDVCPGGTTAMKGPRSQPLSGTWTFTVQFLQLGKFS